MEHEVTERLSVAGRVQGVGFRPSVCRMAKELKLTGTVQNLGGEWKYTSPGQGKR